MKKLLLLFTLFTLMGCEHLPRGISAHFVKEMCSCLFVEKLSEKYCENYSQDLIDVKDYSIDWDKKIVIGNALFNTSQANWENERLGCRLIR